jgi:hypothetical protein
VTTADSELASLVEPSDADLLAHSSRDEGLFGDFYRRHAEFVLAWCYRRSGDAEVAADLAMETFAAAFVNRSRFRPEINVSARPWLIGSRADSWPAWRATVACPRSTGPSSASFTPSS